MRAVFVAPLLLLSACVIGRSERPSQLQAAQGPLATPVTGSPIVPQMTPDNGEVPSPATPPTPDGVWVHGYWHWDGMRYVWQRGHWQR
jgi:WXXGXW repeat (2 copies)